MEAGQKFFAECITGARLDNARVRENHEMQWWKSMRWDNLRVGGSARYEGKGQGKGNPWSGLWDNPPAINVSSTGFFSNYQDDFCISIQSGGR